MYYYKFCKYIHIFITIFFLNRFLEAKSIKVCFFGFKFRYISIYLEYSWCS